MSTTSKSAKKLQAFHAKLTKVVELKPTASDADISSMLKMSVRTVQRNLATLKTSGVVEVKNKRHLHHAFGWCNERTLKIVRSY